MREDFVGAVALNKIARFKLDPRDTRSDADFYELVGDDDGVFGCMTLLGCHDVCPKNLPLATQIAFCAARWWPWPGRKRPSSSSSATWWPTKTPKGQAA
jgi:succinate dehydrogenase/fumarate reductase-like Fe-S protein